MSFLWTGLVLLDIILVGGCMCFNVLWLFAYFYAFVVFYCYVFAIIVTHLGCPYFQAERRDKKKIKIT